jgi:hypothetical protein
VATPASIRSSGRRESLELYPEYRASRKPPRV